MTRGMWRAVGDLVALLTLSVLAVVGLVDVLDRLRPVPVVSVWPVGVADRDSVMVTRYDGETHIVTGDGRLIIVPADRSECVRLALPSAEYAECVPDSVG